MTWVLVAVIVVLLVIIGVLAARQQRSRNLARGGSRRGARARPAGDARPGLSGRPGLRAARGRRVGRSPRGGGELPRGSRDLGPRHNGQADTEQLRQSMVHFRALFDELLASCDTTTDDRDAGRSEADAVSHEPTTRG